MKSWLLPGAAAALFAAATVDAQIPPPPAALDVRLQDCGRLPVDAGAAPGCTGQLQDDDQGKRTGAPAVPGAPLRQGDTPPGDPAVAGPNQGGPGPGGPAQDGARPNSGPGANR